jgi:REP element-mobilizing transposase RayT
MSRRHRSYLPGAAFHLTTRVYGRSPWFDEPMRNRIVRILASVQKRCDAQLHAYSIMTNHLHLVVTQGRDPLWRLMQPLCRRIALRVQWDQNRCGYIFERRFRDHHCATARHLRHTIAYVNHNALDAGLCSASTDWQWSSHRTYVSANPIVGEGQPQVTPLLELFASAANFTNAQLRDNYQSYSAWRIHCRKLGPGVPHPSPPDTTAGDAFWTGRFGAIATDDRDTARPDLRDIVLRAIDQVAPNLSQDEFLSRRGGEVVVSIRRSVVHRAMAVGYRGATIARYLRLSDSAVSRIGALRFPRPQDSSNGQDSRNQTRSVVPVVPKEH